MRGLINYGTHCSINSVVQCLYGTRELRGLIRDIDEQEYRAPKKNTVAAMLKGLICEMDKNNHGSCDPSFLIDSMSAYSGLSFEVQEDSDLVFKCILNALTDDDGPAEKVGQLWDIKMEKRIRCLRCNVVKSTLDKLNTIPVFIEDNLPAELQEYIKQYSDNTLTMCDYHCAHCHTRTQIEITSKVLSLPPVVCMWIARVKNVGRDTVSLVKIDKRLAFPETLDLKYIMKEPEAAADALYELYAVIAHCGSHYSGHYSAYVRGDDTWYLADDTQVRLCSWDTVKSTYEAGSNFYDGVAYMLMYRRRDSSN
ncbi:ubl carboxyl-terminal hydrolase 18-like [Centroberyx gerrardi]|uniref:ubl carboxyl-terminal hydrolase 18-like n=1 Tax=Centroberyx gerrardi TaxID=166262 RepID=UPI003AAAD09C